MNTNCRKAEELNNLLSKYVDQGYFPGIQWKIDINNKIYVGKYGLNNIENHQGVLDNSIYRIWSMTKPIIAVAALQLVEENLISLQDPITEFLPEFIDLKVISKEDGEIDNVEKINHYPTIEDLLLHTAGFSYNLRFSPE